jgi:hypothetical protein
MGGPKPMAGGVANDSKAVLAAVVNVRCIIGPCAYSITSSAMASNDGGT